MCDICTLKCVKIYQTSAIDILIVFCDKYLQSKKTDVGLQGFVWIQLFIAADNLLTNSMAFLQ